MGIHISRNNGDDIIEIQVWCSEMLAQSTYRKRYIKIILKGTKVNCQLGGINVHPFTTHTSKTLKQKHAVTFICVYDNITCGIEVSTSWYLVSKLLPAKQTVTSVFFSLRTSPVHSQTYFICSRGKWGKKLTAHLVNFCATLWNCFYFVWMSICLQVCICTMCMCAAHRGKKRMSGPLNWS